MGGGAGTDAGVIQRFPLAAGTQDKKDAIEALPIRRAWPAPAKAMGVAILGNQRHKQLPEGIAATKMRLMSHP